MKGLNLWSLCNEIKIVFFILVSLTLDFKPLDDSLQIHIHVLLPPVPPPPKKKYSCTDLCMLYIACKNEQVNSTVVKIYWRIFIKMILKGFMLLVKKDCLVLIWHIGWCTLKDVFKLLLSDSVFPWLYPVLFYVL